MCPAWEVLGGGKKGGIVVRSGRELDSPELPERLATGSVVEELDLVGERLSFRKLKGDGPSQGWVSLTFKGKELLVRSTVVPDAAPPRGPDIAALDPATFEEQGFAVELTHATPPNLPDGRPRGVRGRVMAPPEFAGVPPAQRLPLCAVFLGGEYRFRDVDLRDGGNSADGALFNAVAASVTGLGVPIARVDYEGIGMSEGNPFPPDPNVTRWAALDVQAAVIDWALQRADHILLVGFSMGAQAPAIFLTKDGRAFQIDDFQCTLPPALKKKGWVKRVVGFVSLSLATEAPSFYRMKQRPDLVPGPEATMPEYGKLRLPTLIVVGTKDMMVNRKRLKALIEARPDNGRGVQLVEVEGAAHDLGGHEEECAATVVEWLLKTVGLHG